MPNNSRPSPYSPVPPKAPVFDQAKITEFLRAGKLDDARTYLSSIIEGTVGLENDAAVFVQYARAYMQVMNSINKRYLDGLHRAKALLSETKSGNERTEKLLRLAELKANL
ncbi:MAG TPA: hypothetical protein VF438_01650 [Candidatus Paceibacterota bacterium]